MLWTEKMLTCEEAAALLLFWMAVLHLRRVHSTRRQLRMRQIDRLEEDQNTEVSRRIDMNKMNQHSVVNLRSGVPVHVHCYELTGWLLWLCCVLTEATTTQELCVPYGVNLAVSIGGEQYKVGLLEMSGEKRIFVCPGILSHLWQASSIHRETGIYLVSAW